MSHNYETSQALGCFMLMLDKIFMITAEMMSRPKTADLALTLSTSDVIVYMAFVSLATVAKPFSY